MPGNLRLERINGIGCHCARQARLRGDLYHRLAPASIALLGARRESHFARQGVPVLRALGGRSHLPADDSNPSEEASPASEDACQMGLGKRLARKTMNRKPLNVNSQVVSAGYEPETKTLELEFSSGGIYSYEGVPEAEYEGLCRAQSPGHYFAVSIRANYICKRHHVNRCLRK